jgi:uncharacterized iron-regulated membrane protein
VQCPIGRSKPTLERSRVAVARPASTRIHSPSLSANSSNRRTFRRGGVRSGRAQRRILAFREEIDEWLNASIMRVEIPAPPARRPLDEILAAAITAMPADGKAERVTMPRHSASAMAITYLVETDDLDTDVYEMFVDPYTAKVKGQRLYLHGNKTLSQPLVPIIMAFHWTLLLGFNNAYILGSLAILVFFSILVGFICGGRDMAIGGWALKSNGAQAKSFTTRRSVGAASSFSCWLRCSPESL